MTHANYCDRDILHGSSFEENSPVTIYVGLYNAEPFLGLVRENIQRQHGNYPIVVVDNASTDGTWAQVSTWLHDFAGRITLVRNEKNLGGLGSLLLNLDLIKTPWFATLHQDDFYLENHLEVLSAEIHAAGPNVTCIATELGRLHSDGVSEDVSPPRASWGLPDQSRETMFLSNLRLHNVPFPAAAFKTQAFGTYSGPWHSTAFPDTEWILRAICVTDVVLVAKRTVLYRENENSESHSISSDEKEIGAFASLARVFCSDNFVTLANGVEVQERAAFSQALFDGIEVRLGSSNYSGPLQLLAAEQLGLAWNYGDGVSNAVLGQAYSGPDNVRIQTLLASLTKTPIRYTRLPGLVNPAPLGADTGSVAKNARSFALSIFGRMPLSLQRIIFKKLVAHLGRNRSSAWKMDWRNEL